MSVVARAAVHSAAASLAACAWLKDAYSVKPMLCLVNVKVSVIFSSSFLWSVCIFLDSSAKLENSPRSCDC